MHRFQEKILSGNFVVTTELTPPKGIDLSEFFAKADALKGIVDAVVATGSGALVLQRVQPESRSPMSADDWLRGVRPAVGERLGTD